MSSGKSEKPPRIKGLVKRCRSFKEDILSRLARNRSLGGAGDNHGSHSGTQSPSGWSGDSDGCISGHIPGVEPHVSISHRLKEAHLTIQFVESLIQKNCMDLLGGSSNVMLDLMCYILGEVKKVSSTDSAFYHSTISQVKEALSEFLTSVDVLLLRDQKDEGQEHKKVEYELYFQKLNSSLKSIKEALNSLKILVDSKENSVENNGVPLSTTTPKKPSYPDHNRHRNSSAVLGPTRGNHVGSASELHQGQQSSSSQHEQKKPPLPPKLRQWTAKSFDTIDWSGNHSASMASMGSSSSKGSMKEQSQYANAVRSKLCQSNLLPGISANSSSFLNQWLEQPSLASLPGHYPTVSSQTMSSTASQMLSEHSSSRSEFSPSGLHSSVASMVPTASQLPRKSSKVLEVSSCSSLLSPSQQWQDSGSCGEKYAASNASGSTAGSSRLRSKSGKKSRTFSDSYRLDSDESLDNLLLIDDSRSQSAATTQSQSVSLGSSLDNLLLVDSQSQQSGLSPNSGANSVHTRSQKGSVSEVGDNVNRDLANLSTYDPEAEGENDNVFGLQRPHYRIEYYDMHNRTSDGNGIGDAPPALPEKQNKNVLVNSVGEPSTGPYFRNSLSSNIRHDMRCPSPYDNVREGEEIDPTMWQGSVSMYPASPSGQVGRGSDYLRENKRQFICYSESRNTLVGSAASGEIDEKPPLPPKKKHSLITAYVELMHNFDAYTQAHHHHFQNHQQKSLQLQHQYAQSGHAPLHHQYSLQVQGSYYNSTNKFSQNQWMYSPGVSPVDVRQIKYPEETVRHSTLSPSHQSTFSSANAKTPVSPDEGYFYGATITTTSSSKEIPLERSPSLPPALPPKKNRVSVPTDLPLLPRNSMAEVSPQHTRASPPSSLNVSRSPYKPADSSLTDQSPLKLHQSENPKPTSVSTPECAAPVDDKEDIYLVDPKPLLVLNDGSASSNAGKSNADSPEVKGGEPLVLIAYASCPSLTDTKFREVFLLTYRSFIRPLDTVDLLWKRYQHFEKKQDRASVVTARAALELFVDVVKCLTPMDLDEVMVTKVRDCIYHLVRNGEIAGALKARKGLISKFSVRNKLLSPKPPLTSLAVTSVPQTLLQWNATSIAQQMTLLDQDLFKQLEPAELLVWAREQSEDFCPALNNFTEHFNKVSYWARSKVLTCVTSRERNRTMKKLIEVMRKLREYSNFNSLLAVLAALDSAPIRRLGFSRRLTEALKPHAALTDSSGSFRTYRQALSESKPPCIPYLGLVLQDLTFVHIGNVDFLNDGKVNWIKRCQQWLVLEPIRRFHACSYGFSRNDSLLTFLNNFDESLNDDDLWQLSKQIKP